MDDIRFDAARPQPARQPESIPASLEGNGDAFDLVPRLDRFIAPAQQQFQKGVFVGFELL
jgi:hypothetical protein